MLLMSLMLQKRHQRCQSRKTFVDSVTDAIPSLDILRVAAHRRTDTSVDVKWARFLLISNVARVRTSPNAQKAHPQLISNTPAEFGVTPLNGFGALRGIDRFLIF